MIRVIMHGAAGRMGRVITDLVRDDPEIEVVAGIDVTSADDLGYPVYTEAGKCKEPADAVIDFSNVKATKSLLEYCVKRKLPVVLCTTGLGESELEQVDVASKKIAVLRSANMSLGINILMKALRDIAPALAAAGFDIEIVEKHHNQKLDAPSGTARLLADTINDELEGAYTYTYDRTGKLGKRDPKEIGISAVRGGSIPGDHDVIFAGPDEVVTVSHRAYSRAIFAKGAIAAAKWLAGRPAGLYDMSCVLGK